MDGGNCRAIYWNQFNYFVELVNFTDSLPVRVVSDFANFGWSTKYGQVAKKGRDILELYIVSIQPGKDVIINEEFWQEYW